MPDALNAPNAGPYDKLTTVREGSYWNLVMPYALASGFFPPHSRAAHGLVHYVLAHGSRLLGVPRADAHIIYSNRPYGSGLGAVYELSMSRFMADNDHPDQLVLSLYGMLAIGMTPGTYVSGEAISVVPVNGAYYRSMYMPPNSGANASFLETFRQLLVHERRGPSGAPVGLDLAFSTPRAWLADGKTISVQDAPTSFGPVSFSIARTGSRIAVQLDGSAEGPGPSSTSAAGRRAGPERVARRAARGVRNDRSGRTRGTIALQRDRHALSAAGRSARRYSTV